MICLIALIVFGFLAIFSATHRPLAKEALDCVLRKTTFRPCKTNLDQRLRSQFTGMIMKRSPKLAGFTFKYFTILSWIFVLLLTLSTVYSGIGIYNYVKYGNCNGPHNAAFCIFNPVDSGEISCGSQHCAEEGCSCGEAESLCTEENNFAPCDRDCDCNTDVCGPALE